MATNAPITGAPTCAPTLTAFDFTRLDDVSGNLSVTRSLIDVSIDTHDTNSGDAENLLHAALAILAQADERFQSIHTDLLAIQREESGNA